MSEQQSFDLLLRGGHVICPASGVNGVMDVAVRDGKIVAVRPDILPSSAKGWSTFAAGWCCRA
jgi:dihydroorotase